MPLDVTIFILRIGAAVALYAFMGMLLYFLWQDFSRQAYQHENVKRQAGWLVVIESDDRTVRVGHRFALGVKTTIGRSPTSTVVLNNPFTSNIHALITFRNKRWWLEDHDSKNGTFLNDRNVEEPTVLGTSDIIQIGTIKLLVEFEEPV